MFAQIIDYAARAFARVLTQFRTSAEVVGITNAISSEAQLLEDAIYGTFVLRDLDASVGATLDSLGKLVRAPARGSLGDSDYRLRVKTQVLVNKSNGTPADLVGIAKTFHPAWASTVKTREGGPTAAGYLTGSPTGQSPHNGSIELVCVPDTAGSGIIESEANELGHFLKAAVAGGVRLVFLYRPSTIAANQAFRFSGGSPPETAVGFGVGKLFNSLDR